ncbi:MAG: hypothetical protein KF708_23340 [Pirellulales bacterium]|nr:hypothetical protein [Pirellulales bacterium]
MLAKRSRPWTAWDGRGWLAGLVAVGLLACVVAVVAAAESTSTASSDTEAAIEQRRARIAAMSTAERDSLARAVDRFHALDRIEQQRLRELRQRIDRSPDRAKLEGIVEHYYDWVASLSAGKRAEIQALPPAERLAKVKQELAEEAGRNENRLGLQDYLVLANWLRTQFEERVFADIDDDRRREELRSQPEARRRAAVAYWMARRIREGEGPRPLEQVSREAVDELKAQLSPASRAQLERADSIETQRRVIARWLHDFGQRMSRRQFGSLLDDISEADLTEFFEHKLDDERREQLLSQSPDEMWHELRWEYLRAQMPDLFEGRSFRGRGDYRGGPPVGRPDGRPPGPPPDRAGGRTDRHERRPPPQQAPAP